MPGEVRWRYSKVVGGKPHELDALMEAGLLVPNSKTSIMRHPLKVTDPEPIGSDAIRGLPDGSIIAMKVDANEDTIFHFTSVHVKPTEAVRPSIPVERILDEGEEYLRDKLVQGYKAEFRIGAEANSLVLDALTASTRREILKRLGKVPEREWDNLHILEAVIGSLRAGGTARESGNSGFLEELSLATSKALRHIRR